MLNFAIVPKIPFAYMVISISVTVSSIGSMRARWVNSLGESELDGLDGSSMGELDGWTQFWARWVSSIMSSICELDGVDGSSMGWARWVSLMGARWGWARWARWWLDGSLMGYMKCPCAKGILGKHGNFSIVLKRLIMLGFFGYLMIYLG